MDKLKLTWEERIRRMREDYNSESWDFLFFKIWMNIIEAQDTFDYHREQVLRELHVAYLYDKNLIGDILDRLEVI